MEVTFISDTVQRYISRCVLRHRFTSSVVQMPGRGFTYGDNLGVELLKPTIWNFSGISPQGYSHDHATRNRCDPLRCRTASSRCLRSNHDATNRRGRHSFSEIRTDSIANSSGSRPTIVASIC